MQRAAIVAISLAAGVPAASARPVSDTPVAEAVNTDFWREIIEPHGDEVRRIITNARNGIRIADEALQADSEWAVDLRMRYFEDAYGMLRYAHKLSPENTEVLALLGRAADELGKTRQAIEALVACAELMGPDKVTPEVAGRLGIIYLRTGDRDAAIRYLRLAQAPLRAETAQPLAHLANALAARGDVPGAVDVLINAMPAQVISYYSHEMTLATFTLAVIYDRDEQRSAAFDVLDKMKATHAQSFVPQVQNALATMRYAPAEDQHYYLALLYEAEDQFVEARAQWALYAASGDSPWRARALEHIAAIDKLRRLPPKAAPAATTIPGVAPMRRRIP